MLRTILFLFYRYRLFRRWILSIARRSGESEFTSVWLRELFKRYHNVEVGMYSYGCFSPGIQSGTVVGRFTSITEGLEIIGGDHMTSTVTTHPFIYNPEVGVVDRLLRAYEPLTIGHDVWIGHQVIILPKVHRIGDGAVIGAGTVVTKEVPPYAVVAGVPGKVVKYRFPPEVVAKLLEIRWWDWPPERIFKSHQLFNDIDAFLEAYEQGRI